MSERVKLEKEMNGGLALYVTFSFSVVPSSTSRRGKRESKRFRYSLSFPYSLISSTTF